MRKRKCSPDEILKALRQANAGTVAAEICWELGEFPELGVSFETTHLIEGVMARLEAKTQRGTSRRTSDQKLRWCALALRVREHQLRDVQNHRHLPLRKQAVQHTI